MCAKMVHDAKETLSPHKNIQIDHHQVAGCLELGNAAAKLAHYYDALILFGVVIRGETAHFDYVCQGVTIAHAELNIQQKTPIIFGVLTVENKQQALERISGPVEIKGSDCARSALIQLHLAEKISSLKPKI